MAFSLPEEVQKRRTRYEPNLQNHLDHVRNGYVVVFELAKGRGKVAAQKLVRILTAAVLGMILSGAALPAYTATLTMLVTSDLTHTIAGPCFLLGPDGQPVQITGDGNAEKAPTVVIMGSLNGVKLRAIPLTARKFHCGAGQLYGKRQFSLIYGAANRVTNSYRDVKGSDEILRQAPVLAQAGKWDELSQLLQKAILESGGQVMVMGGANTVDKGYLS